ncbi:MAG TPA: hypothetical protein VGJ84_04735, partial [Polyangiaceae bacterium]
KPVSTIELLKTVASCGFLCLWLSACGEAKNRGIPPCPKSSGTGIAQGLQIFSFEDSAMILAPMDDLIVFQSGTVAGTAYVHPDHWTQFVWELAAPGHDSPQALHFAYKAPPPGEPTWGWGADTGWDFQGYDASQYAGLSFWLKGEGEDGHFILGDEKGLDTGPSRECTFSLTEEWTRYDVRWGSVTDDQGHTGYTGSSVRYAIFFIDTETSPSTNIDLWVDDVAFMSRTP